ncbi:OmpA family protein [Phenylobacterium soli]|uniref:OmpA family protein n=2 Tax=Phenylobacterium soli TaxID=2170551 RepID=A0A328ANS5_9CAUL|nr:OmpA family protein [Phenylobacterium soli]
MVLATAVAFGAAASLGGCATVQNARARLVRASARCVDQTVQIYFEPQSAALTREGRLVIDQAASQARGCRVTTVDVVGLADAAGAPDANLELSKRRAEAVAAALAANGLPAADFQVGAAGQAGAVTADGKAAPLRRRADVTLHLAAR